MKKRKSAWKKAVKPPRPELNDHTNQLRPQKNTKPQVIQDNPETEYRRIPLLTRNEYNNYLLLRNYAAAHDLIILAKIRLADLIEPKPEPNRTIWQKRFNMISSKHVDFALCDRDMNVLIIIELDDSSHRRPDRQARDRFVDAVLKNSGYKILHISAFEYATLNELNNLLGYGEPAPEPQPIPEQSEKLYVRLDRTEPTYEEWKAQHIAQTPTKN